MTNNFIKAYKNLIGAEGGYSNNVNDLGAETYKGISRKFHSDWAGWKLIDEAKESNSSISNRELSKILNKNSELEELVQMFYYNNYWNKFKGDELDYDLAEELLEQSVVLGTWKTAGKNIQTALNLLNRDGKLYKDLVVDGFVGAKTIEAVNKVNNRRLLTVLNGLEFCRFKESMDKRPMNEVFAGWFNRVNFTIS